jgi:hypothetical protein
MIEDLIPVPRKLEVDRVDLAAPPQAVWEYVRHANLAESPLVRALFGLRELPSRLRGAPIETPDVRIDDLRSTPDRPGFQLFDDDVHGEVLVGAIGKVWHLDIPFLHVADARAYREFSDPGWVKVAWTMRVEPLEERATRFVVEVRVDATDDASWTKFTRYWRFVGPGSHFIRRTLLAHLRRRFGALSGHEDQRSLRGDLRAM